MRSMLAGVVLVSAASTLHAGPIPTVDPGTTADGLPAFVFGLDPDGEASYTAVEVTATASRGEFRTTQQFPPPGGGAFGPGNFTGIIGVGTVTEGFSILGPGIHPTSLGFTLTSLGGPPTSSFSGDLFQIVETPGESLLFSVTYRFADANGQELTEFETAISFVPEPTAASLLGAILLVGCGRRARRRGGEGLAPSERTN